ncbi:hypothetical protein BKI52_09155 [marine bacterium AO1-C]|nr:hypothetical protein BKI52_09155 [marine bacterium AO1-C]
MNLKSLLIFGGLFLLGFAAIGQGIRTTGNQYEPSKKYPFGRPNPTAPKEITQFAFMVGQCDCVDSIRLVPGDPKWTIMKSTWDGKYIMNGTAIQDGGPNGRFNPLNIRIYDEKQQKWVVTYFTTPKYGSGVWKGKKEGNKMIMRQASTSPNGRKGENRLTFYNISKNGFSWKGEFVSEDGTVAYAFWKIQCTKVKR